MNNQPNATLHNPDPEYIRALVTATGLSQEAAAHQIGVSPRIMRYYLAGEHEAPYPVQYCLEQLRK